MLEGLAVAISWGFESPLPHQSLGTPRSWGGRAAQASAFALLGLQARVPPSAPLLESTRYGLLRYDTRAPSGGPYCVCAKRGALSDGMLYGSVMASELDPIPWTRSER